MLCGALAFILFTGGLYAQEQTVSGTVINSEDGTPIPGVNVIIKGTATGTATDIEGKYALNVPDAETILAFSFIGFVTKEVQLGNRSIVDVTMTPDITHLGEVVIASFGIKKEKRAITYAAQNVETKEITEARPLNLMDGLSGKVAGISVTKTGTGVGSASKVILRGLRSIAGSSQPLYVIDGGIIGGTIAGLSPDDIKSITVLKGANAAALYGSRANNGVIVVTTKSGSGNKNFAVSLNSSFMASSPIILTDFQNEYGQGDDGIYNPNTYRNWGPKMDGSQKEHWSNDPHWPETTTDYSPQPNNVRDFFQTGHNAAVNIGISTSTDISNAYFSYTYTNAAGNVPNNDLISHNLNVRYGATVLKKLTLDSKINYIRRKINNQLSSGGGFSNPIRAAFLMPRNIKVEDAKHYEFYDVNGQLKQNYWVPGNNYSGNPYWTINRNLSENLGERLIGLMSLKYNFTDNLSLLVRSSLDRYNFANISKYYNDTYIIAQDGFYQNYEGVYSEWNTDFLLNYDNRFGTDWTLDVSFGGNIRKYEYRTIIANWDNMKSWLNVPNLFSLANTAFVTASEYYSQKEVQSLYGFATIGWKNAIYLDLTGRNDWSSTLPKDNWSYFYPSLGLTVVISDLVNTDPKWLSLLKLRGSYAEVGNDTDPYKSARAAYVIGGGTGGFLQLSNTLPADTLKPERTVSTEIGLESRFFNNRLGLDLTWYKTNSTNQLFQVNVPVGSGASSVFTNAGDIQNKGVEAILTAIVIDVSKFNWDLIFNFAANRSKVVKITEGLTNLPIAGAGYIGNYRLVEGEPWGVIYSKGFLRDEQGRAIADIEGKPMITPGSDIPVANFNPDWLGGIRNILTYGNLELSFLIDIRAGGTITSYSNSLLWGNGLTTATLQGRDGSLVFGENIFENETVVLEDGSPNNIQVDAEKFWKTLGGRHPVGEAFVIDASNIRLRELVLGYSLPESVLDRTAISGVRFAIVGRNLFFFSNNSNYDPEIFVDIYNSEGWEAFSPPTTREYGINIKIEF